MLTSNDKFEKIGLFIIIGGALSNILDRLIHGYVIDFISIHYNKSVSYTHLTLPTNREV